MPCARLQGTWRAGVGSTTTSCGSTSACTVRGASSRAKALFIDMGIVSEAADDDRAPAVTRMLAQLDLS